MNVIIFGPPGAGKGTQAQNIVNKFKLHQFSTGDLLRNEIKNKTEVGNKIEQIINQGDFVTDDIVNKLLKKFITNPLYRNRIIFDGYPRNITQAESLEIMLNSDNQSINYILFLMVNRDIIEKRILGRVTCEKCNKTLNEYLNKEEIEQHGSKNKSDSTGEELGGAKISEDEMLALLDDDVSNDDDALTDDDASKKNDDDSLNEDEIDALFG